MKSLEELANYAMGAELPKDFAAMRQQVEILEFNAAVMALLDWLKWRSRTRSQKRSLNLRTQYSWSSVLIAMIEECESLKTYFWHNEGTVDFRPRVNEDEQTKVEDLVDRIYDQPTME